MTWIKRIDSLKVSLVLGNRALKVQIGRRTYADASNLRQNLGSVKTHFNDSFNLYNKIHLLSSFCTSDQHPIRVGLLTNDLQNKKVLETMLVDPFDQKEWYHSLKKRDLTKNNLIKITDSAAPIDLNEEMDIYNISSVNDKFAKTANIEFLEINDLAEHDRSVISGAQDLDESNTSAKASDNNNFECHLYIYIKSSPFEDLPNDPRFANWPMTTVLNSSNVAVSGSELCIDIESAYKANELLMESMENATQYTDLIAKSNLMSLIELINKLTTSDFVVPNLLKTIVDQLYIELSNEFKVAAIANSDAGQVQSTNHYKLRLQSLQNVQAHLLESVRSWEQNSHLELQQTVKPYCDQLMNPKFGDIIKLLFKIDDLTVIYENMLLSNGYLVQSERAFEQLSGQITSTNSQTTSNAFDVVKTELALVKLPEVQEAIHSQVLKDFWTVHLPVVTVCTALHIFYDFQINTMLAILCFGFAISLNNISRATLSSFKNLEAWYLEASRIAIEKNSQALQTLITSKIDQDKSILQDKFQVINNLNREITETGN